MSRFLSPLSLMIPLLLIVWGIAVWGSDADAIWIDEWWTGHYAGTAPNNELSGPDAVIGRVSGEGSAHENNPVGYYVVLHLWSRLAGKSDFALRLYSGLCIVVSVALMYQLGRRVGGAQVGVVSAFLLGLSAFYLNYSHELRMYGQAAVFGVAMLLAYWRFMFGQRSAWAWGFVLMISAAGLMYTHYSNAVMIGLLGLIHLFVRPRGARWWRVIGLSMGTLLLFAPHLPITLNIITRFTTKVSTAETYQQGIWTIPELLRQIIAGFANEQPVLVLLLLIALIATLTLRLLPHQRRALVFSGVLSLGGIVLLVILLRAFRDLFHVRYLLVAWSPMALFCALILTISLQRLNKQTQHILLGLFVAAWSITGLVLALDIRFHGLTYSHPFFHDTLTEPTRWDLLEPVLRDESREGDALVVSVGDYKPWIHTGSAEYYTYGHAARLLLLEAAGINETNFPDFIHGAGRVWMARTVLVPPSDEFVVMEDTLAADGYTSCGPAREIGGVAVTLYSIAPQCCMPPETVLGQFGDTATLRYLDVSVEGTSVAVWQGWDVTSPQYASYSVGLFAFNDEGTVVGQRDMTLPAQGYTCILSEFEASVPNPALSLTVYDWGTGARLSVAEGAADNLLPLLTEE